MEYIHRFTIYLRNTYTNLLSDCVGLTCIHRYVKLCLINMHYGVWTRQGCVCVCARALEYICIYFGQGHSTRENSKD